MNDDEQTFVEHWCVGRLSDEALALAESLAARSEADPADVDGRALDGLDDVRSFLHRW